jgi:hypothetical protein
VPDKFTSMSLERFCKHSGKVDLESKDNVKRFLHRMIRNIDSYDYFEKNDAQKLYNKTCSSGISLAQLIYLLMMEQEPDF